MVDCLLRRWKSEIMVGFATLLLALASILPSPASASFLQDIIVENRSWQTPVQNELRHELNYRNQKKDYASKLPSPASVRSAGETLQSLIDRLVFQAHLSVIQTKRHQIISFEQSGIDATEQTSTPRMAPLETTFQSTTGHRNQAGKEFTQSSETPLLARANTNQRNHTNNPGIDQKEPHLFQKKIDNTTDIVFSTEPFDKQTEQTIEFLHNQSFLRPTA